MNNIIDMQEGQSYTIGGSRSLNDSKTLVAPPTSSSSHSVLITITGTLTTRIVKTYSGANTVIKSFGQSVWKTVSKSVTPSVVFDICFKFAIEKSIPVAIEGVKHVIRSLFNL